MAIAKQFIKRVSDPALGDREILDKKAFTKYAREQHVKSLARTREDDEKALGAVNKMISSIAGVADLKNLEADYEVLNIHRDSIPMDVAEIRPMPLGTLPIYRTKTLNPVAVSMGGLAGVGGSVYWATSQSATQVFPFTFTTDKVMVPNLNNLYDMQRLQERRDGLDQLNRYLDLNYSNIVMNTIFGASDVVATDPAAQISTYVSGGGSFSGKNVFVLDPGVPTGALPSGNVYSLTSEKGLTKRVFQTLNTHAIKIGRRMVKMYIPIQAATNCAPVWESLQNLATPVALVTGTDPETNAADNTHPGQAVPHEIWSRFQSEDFRGSVRVNWFGLDIEISKQNWLPAGSCLVFSDQPACIVWERLNLESGAPMDGTLETPADGFYSYVAKSKQIATAQPGFLLKNFAVLQVQ